MPELPWQVIEDELQGLKEVGMLECIYFVMLQKPPANYVPQESPEHTPFTEAITSVPERGTKAPMRSSVVAVLCRPGLRL